MEERFGNQRRRRGGGSGGDRGGDPKWRFSRYRAYIGRDRLQWPQGKGRRAGDYHEPYLGYGTSTREWYSKRSGTGSAVSGQAAKTWPGETGQRFAQVSVTVAGGAKGNRICNRASTRVRGQQNRNSVCSWYRSSELKQGSRDEVRAAWDTHVEDDSAWAAIRRSALENELDAPRELASDARVGGSRGRRREGDLGTGCERGLVVVILLLKHRALGNVQATVEDSQAPIETLSWNVF